MAEFEVLVTGYVVEGDDGEHVQATISLVRSGPATVVVDPGLLPSPNVLIDALSDRGLDPADITHVFVTHHHIDHVRWLGLFTNATVIDGDSTFAGDIWGEIAEDPFGVPDLQVIRTPGHSPECASLVADTAEGKVVFTHAWWFSDMTPDEDPVATDQTELEKSRKKILGIASMIVPGHGEPFSVTSSSGRTA